MTGQLSPNGLPTRTLSSRLTRELGHDVTSIEAVRVERGDVVRLRFESATPIRRQGVWVATQGELGVASSKASQFVLWSDTAPGTVDISVHETDGLLRFYNVYESPPDSGRYRSQMNGSGMVLSAGGDGWSRYSCNDFGIGEGFEKLTFSILVTDHL
jgi:hypothetical protein